jgi:hypothetical protein
MPEAAFEQSNSGIDVRAVLRTGLAIAVVLVLATAGAYVLWRASSQPSARDAPNAKPDFEIAGAMLQSAPQTDRAAFMAEKEKLLHTWEWIDPAAGIVRIPIDDAMRILAEHGAAAPDKSQAKGQAKRQGGEAGR